MSTRDDLARVQMTSIRTVSVEPDRVEEFEAAGWTRGTEHVLTVVEVAEVLTNAADMWPDIEARNIRNMGIRLVRTEQEAEPYVNEHEGIVSDRMAARFFDAEQGGAS